MAITAAGIAAADVGNRYFNYSGLYSSSYHCQVVDTVRKIQFFYRVGQFFKVLLSRPDETQLNKISQILEPDQFGLFMQLQNSEQAHAIHVMEIFEQEGYQEKDFLKAALLHDIGKIVHPLKLWERVISVICRWINPDCLDNLVETDIRGWKRGETSGVGSRTDLKFKRFARVGGAHP
jgi:hypothetical protein